MATCSAGHINKQEYVHVSIVITFHKCERHATRFPGRFISDCHYLAVQHMLFEKDSGKLR